MDPIPENLKTWQQVYTKSPKSRLITSLVECKLVDYTQSELCFGCYENIYSEKCVKFYKYLKQNCIRLNPIKINAGTHYVIRSTHNYPIIFPNDCNIIGLVKNNWCIEVLMDNIGCSESIIMRPDDLIDPFIAPRLKSNGYTIRLNNIPNIILDQIFSQLNLNR